MRVFDRADFLARVDCATATQRDRRVATSDGSVVHEHKVLVRLEATRRFVDPGEGEALVTGRIMSLNRLKKAIETV
jgi:hypothetical protein